MVMLRRIKDRLAKIMQKKTKPATTTGEPKGGFKVKKAADKERKEFPGELELAIEKAKFYSPQTPSAKRLMPQDLPEQYDQDKILLQVRDPRWIHAYWEVRNQTIEKLKNDLKDDFHKAKRILRVYDVSHIIFDGTNAHRFFDLQINEAANNWYIDTAGPGRSWCVDLGLLLPDGRFIMLVRSNTVQTPIEGPSWITDEEWMIPDDMFARLYGMGFGLGRSSPVGKAWAERVKKALFSGILASPGITSVSSPEGKAKQRKFWLVADCELIVYGATEPDAKVYVQDRQINLRQDGTFTLRFALPNGKQDIPIKAVSPDDEEKRTITPIVTRETK